MTHSYKATHLGRHWRKLALLGLLSLGYQAAQAQTPVRYAPSAVQNVAGTYTDLGTTGTAITTANTDDDNSATTPLGFTFQFNGQSFTDFVLNTNGIIRLGTAAPSATNLFGVYENGQAPGVDPITSTSAADVNLIAPFNFDLEAGSATGGTEYRVSTTGTAPNRVTTIQWKNVSDKAGGNAKQYASFNFQVKLYETTNNIEFVYGPAVAATTGTDIARYPTVGIKGSGSAAGQTVLGNRTSSAAAWSTTAFITGVYTTSTHNFRRSTTPDVGRTYRFRPQLANDASVATIHTLGKLAVPNSLPHTVAAAVTNNGSNALTNVPVTLTVTGANTFTSTKTIATLAPGTTQAVTFDAYPTTLATGTNNLTVTIPADDENSNNSLPYTQKVTADQVAYVDDTRAFAGSVGVGSDGGILATKYKNTQTTTVSRITAYFLASTTASTYRFLVMDASGTGGTPGTVLYTSPIQTRPTAASIVTFTVPQPAPVITGDFYLGVQEVAGNVGIAYQQEDPLRTGTFYYQTPGSAWIPVNNTALRTRLGVEATFSPVPTCLPPTNVAVTDITATTATVTFTAANANGTGYTVVYGPRGFNPATSGTTVSGATSPITITGLTSGMPYDVYVRTACGTTETSYLSPAVVSFTTVCVAPQITAFPYSQNFDSGTASLLPCGVTVANVNNDTRTWTPASTDVQGGAPASAPYHMRYIYSPNFAADDWFFLPAMTLQAGFTYQVAFKYKAAVNNSSEKLEVKYGTATTPAGQTNLLWRNESITNTTYATTTAGTAAGQVLPITPTTTGTYYVGFRVFSDANQYNLYVDDVTVTATAVTSSSAALLRAISVFPNPSAGKLSIEVSNANARNGLQVEISNMVGQRVHTATIRDNMTNQLDLSGLANGMYVVKVRNGNEYMVRNISIQK
ncbi:T9SS type A sorting domain-containing protein [Hymenobacter endophyticus]|uniref:T9SS type A sorting domain-containing protein n=1 Tax=Hymenobacter endophyticus TaxID=3076335 RepID=A0ABU3TMK0_9BACT|nr:T9SS type A sorting domain-containing protein [Hymenobacter endophyticus]MDU0372616.1 T9SS type A sorting domain-containing protein [Hymenobacter endophyticus]